MVCIGTLRMCSVPCVPNVTEQHNYVARSKPQHCLLCDKTASSVSGEIEADRPGRSLNRTQEHRGKGEIHKQSAQVDGCLKREGPIEVRVMVALESPRLPQPNRGPEEECNEYIHMYVPTYVRTCVPNSAEAITRIATAG